MNAFATLTTGSLVTLMFFGSSRAADKPSFETDLYGYVKLDASYDQNLTSHGNFVVYLPEPAYDGDDEQYNMTANETRLGLDVIGRDYARWTVNAKVEFDLYAAVTGATVSENKAMLQLRHAYFTIQRNGTRLLAGQSWDIIAPLIPPTLNYTVLWGCGNIGYRRPQLSLWHTAQPDSQTTITLAAGIFRTIGNDLPPTFGMADDEETEGIDDGTDAGIPSAQGLLDFQYASSSGTKLRCGVSGLWGQLKAETTLGKEETYESWAFAGHLRLDLAGGFGVQGEAYTGANLGTYFGAIARNSTVEGLDEIGGWGTVFVQASPKVSLAAGFGIDDLRDEDVAEGRSKNTAYCGTVRYTLAPQVTVGLELSHWETQYAGAEDARSFRVQTSFILNY